MDIETTNPFAERSAMPDVIGGYALLAAMDDGGTLCEPCTVDPANPVTDQRSDLHGGGYSGWGVVGFFTSGDIDEDVSCDHCGRVIEA